MATKYVIPPKARKVAEILRRDVKRPKEPPELLAYDTVDKPKSALRWRNGAEQCPMGLHPMALISLPFLPYHFPPCDGDGDAVTQFAVWWDRLRDPKAAMNALWPPKKKTAKSPPRKAKKK